MLVKVVPTKRLELHSESFRTYCHYNNMKLLSMADFGKVMKQVFPKVRPRRLGTRGHSRYCYAGLRKKRKLAAPELPDLLNSSPPIDQVITFNYPTI